jgi:hypothetical protein
MTHIMAEDEIPCSVDKYRNLLMAVVHRAVIDYLDDTHDRVVSSVYAREPSLRAKAQMFLFDEAQDDHSEPFTFRWIAEHLSEDADAFMASIRAKVLKAPKRTEVRRKQGMYVNVFQEGVRSNWRTAG